MIADPASDFDHPGIPDSRAALRRHVFCRPPQFSRRSKAKKAEVCKPWLVTGAVLRCAMTKALQLAMAKAAIADVSV